MDHLDPRFDRIFNRHANAQAQQTFREAIRWILDAIVRDNELNVMLQNAVTTAAGFDGLAQKIESYWRAEHKLTTDVGTPNYLKEGIAFTVMQIQGNFAKQYLDLVDALKNVENPIPLPPTSWRARFVLWIKSFPKP